MKKIWIVFVLVLLLGCGEKAAKMPVIFDSDFGPDYDDVGAITLLHAFADSGLIDIKASVASNANPLTAPSINVFNTYFGRPEIPVGAPTSAPDMDCFQNWTDSITARYPHAIKSNAEAENAVSLYRRILAKADDTSMVIVTVGFLTNMKDLLQSAPDSLSALNGIELVKQKVNRLVCMAGAFPSGREYNVFIDSTASKYVFENWPGRIIFSGADIGSVIRTGKRVIAQPGNSPVKEVFRISMPVWSGDMEGRCSWDQTAILIAVCGTSPYFNTTKGRIIVNTNGSNSWENDPAGLHEYVTFRQSVNEIGTTIENLMMHRRK